MVGFDSSSHQLTAFQYAFAGGISGASTRFISQPLDVLKIRFQLQVDPITRGSKYTSIYQAFKTILKDEGFKTLWVGHIPAQLLSISYGLSQFWCYEMLTEVCHNSSLDKKPTVVVNFVCGALSGAFATVISFPFDTIRTRLVAEEKNKRVYKGVINAFVCMTRDEGFLSLYKGLFPTVAQVAPHAGVQFMTYKIFSDMFKKFSISQSQSISLVGSLSAGSLAGLTAKISIYPFDLAKKRLQIQGFQQYRTGFGQQIYCRGFLDCIKITLKYEGISGLYKGLVPSLYKAMLVSALHFSLYEETCKFLHNINES